MPDIKKLVRKSLEVRKAAYAPYSGFLVGAALLSDNGEVFVGCNVENGSFGLTICAERVAVATAVAAGCRTFQAIAVATEGGHSPCGACRQVLAEFNSELPVFLVDVDQPDRCSETTLDQLLPGLFRFPRDLT